MGDVGGASAKGDVAEETRAIAVDKEVEDEEDASDDAGEDEEDEEEEEEEEEEPRLKYQRLTGTLGETLKKDAVSAMAVCDRFLALGTHWGVVHILDLNGNDVKRFENHSATVSDVAIDTAGEFVASAGDDGKVVISSLYTTDVQTTKHKRPVKSVALEPDYSKKQTRQFVCGGMGESLLLSGKGWFGATDIVIHSGEGPVYTVRWRGTFIAWANEAGVKIYDTASQQKFAYIDRPQRSPRADLYRCNLCWSTPETLLIGWADSVKVGVVRERSKMDVASGLPARYVEIVAQFRTDFIVCGIAPIGNDIVLLSYLVELNEDRNIELLDAPPPNQLASAPEVHIVDMNGDHVANDVLSLFGYEHYRASDYRLECLPGAVGSPNESAFYIVSPKDIVVARPRDPDDHIEWLVGRERYEEALAAADEARNSGWRGRLGVADVIDIGCRWLDTLVQAGDWSRAANSVTSIVRGDKALWETWIARFAEAGQASVIRTFIPLKDPVLSSHIYDLVLAKYLETDHAGFLELIKEWPQELYSLSAVADAVTIALQQHPNDKYLLTAAVDLQASNHRFDQSLLSGLRAGVKDILALVPSHNLFSTVEANIPLVMDYDERAVKSGAEPDLSPFGWRDEPTPSGIILATRRAGLGDGVTLLSSNLDRIPLSTVMTALSDRPRWLHIYLDAVWRRDPLEAAEAHGAMVSLYADHDPARLLQFLRGGGSYDVRAALAECEIRDMVPEMVYLLGKLGDNRRALALLIERLGDVKKAIAFAMEQGDKGLWDDLLKYSMDKPPFILGLLESLGAFGGAVDPAALIRRIPDKTEIPGLRNALVNVLADLSVQLSLRAGCERVLSGEAVELMRLHDQARRRGVRVEADGTCGICNLGFIVDESADSLVLFFCNHIFHQACLNVDLASRATGAVPVPTSTSSPTLSPRLSASSPTRNARRVTPKMLNSIKAIYESGRIAKDGVSVSAVGRTMLDAVAVDARPDPGPFSLAALVRPRAAEGDEGAAPVGIHVGMGGNMVCPLCRGGTSAA